MKKPVILRLCGRLLPTLLTALFAVGNVRAVGVVEYSIPTPNSVPGEMVVGPDGNLWFTEYRGNKIARLTPEGVFTEFPLPTPQSIPTNIVASSDGNLWFAEPDLGRIGRITPQGVITEYSLPGKQGVGWLAAGKDGVLWFSSYKRDAGRTIIGKIVSGNITEFDIPSGATIAIRGFAADASGNLWYSQEFGSLCCLGRLTPDGAYSQYPIPLASGDNYGGVIKTGPDGNLWYYVHSNSTGLVRLIRVPVDGASDFVTLPPLGGSITGFTGGSDGNFWFAYGQHRFGRIAPGGKAMLYDLGGDYSFGNLVRGPEGDFWFFSISRNTIVRLLPDGEAVVTRATSYVQGSVAADSIVTLFGQSLAAMTESATALPLPATLAGVSVVVRDGGGTVHTAPLFMVSPSQINLLMPPQAQRGSATLTVVSSDGRRVATATTIIDAPAPGIFTATMDGQGLPAGLIYRVRADGSTSYEPVFQRDANNGIVAAPIDFGPAGDQLFLVLFGSGLRKSNPSGYYYCYVGSEVAEVLYAGSQGVYAGLDQVNLRLPRTLAGKGKTRVVLYNFESFVQRNCNEVSVFFK